MPARRVGSEISFTSACRKRDIKEEKTRLTLRNDRDRSANCAKIQLGDVDAIEDHLTLGRNETKKSKS